MIQDAQTHFSNYTLEITTKNVYPQDKSQQKQLEKERFLLEKYLLYTSYINLPLVKNPGLCSRQNDYGHFKVVIKLISIPLS